VEANPPLLVLLQRLKAAVLYQELLLPVKKALKLFGIKNRVMHTLLEKMAQNIKIFSLVIEFLMLKRLKKYLKILRKMVLQILLQQGMMESQNLVRVRVHHPKPLQKLLPIPKKLPMNGKTNSTGFTTSWRI